MFQLSLSLLSLSHDTHTHTHNLSASRSRLFLLHSPCLLSAQRVHTHIHTVRAYVPTFNDRYAFNCSPSPSPARDYARLSEREPRRYFPRRVIGEHDIEDRPRENCNVTHRGVSRRYRRYRDIAMRRVAPRRVAPCRAAPRRGVDQLASLRLSLSLLLVARRRRRARLPVLRVVCVKPIANRMCRRALDICFSRGLCIGCVLEIRREICTREANQCKLKNSHFFFINFGKRIKARISGVKYVYR